MGFWEKQILGPELLQCVAGKGEQSAAPATNGQEPPSTKPNPWHSLERADIPQAVVPPLTERGSWVSAVTRHLTPSPGPGQANNPTEVQSRACERDVQQSAGDVDAEEGTIMKDTVGMDYSERALKLASRKKYEEALKAAGIAQRFGEYSVFDEVWRRIELDFGCNSKFPWHTECLFQD